MSEEKAGEDRTYRRGFVTKHQVTGWRFLMRRIASGVALHDARMLVDGREIYTAKDLRVGLFTSTDDF